MTKQSPTNNGIASPAARTKQFKVIAHGSSRGLYGFDIKPGLAREWDFRVREGVRAGGKMIF